jgi:hypothetical protein
MPIQYHGTYQSALLFEIKIYAHEYIKQSPWKYRQKPVKKGVISALTTDTLYEKGVISALTSDTLCEGSPYLLAKQHAQSL